MPRPSWTSTRPRCGKKLYHPTDPSPCHVEPTRNTSAKKPPAQNGARSAPLLPHLPTRASARRPGPLPRKKLDVSAATASMQDPARAPRAVGRDRPQSPAARPGSRRRGRGRFAATLPSAAVIASLFAEPGPVEPSCSPRRARPRRAGGERAGRAASAVQAARCERGRGAGEDGRLTQGLAPAGAERDQTVWRPAAANVLSCVWPTNRARAGLSSGAAPRASFRVYDTARWLVEDEQVRLSDEHGRELARSPERSRGWRGSKPRDQGCEGLARRARSPPSAPPRRPAHEVPPWGREW